MNFTCISFICWFCVQCYSTLLSIIMFTFLLMPDKISQSMFVGTKLTIQIFCMSFQICFCIDQIYGIPVSTAQLDDTDLYLGKARWSDPWAWAVFQRWQSQGIGFNFKLWKKNSWFVCMIKFSSKLSHCQSEKNVGPNILIRVFFVVCFVFKIS